jgi:hypothetical protein
LPLLPDEWEAHAALTQVKDWNTADAAPMVALGDDCVVNAEVLSQVKRRHVLALSALSLFVPTLAAAREASPYDDLFIIRPRNGETLHDNDGLVRVQVAIEPVLQVAAEHRLRVLLDGQLWPAAWVMPELNLRGVDRGTHRIQVIVTDREGRQLAASAVVEFHLRRASRLAPRTGPAR